MKAKEYLNQIAKIDALIESKQAEIQRWADLALSITAPISGERVQSSPTLQRMEDAINCFVDIQTELEKTIRDLSDARSRIIRTIEMIPVDEYKFLHAVYVLHYSLSEVADRGNYSYSWATTMHGKALRSVQQIIDREECYALYAM